MLVFFLYIIYRYPTTGKAEVTGKDEREGEGIRVLEGRTE